MHTANTLDSGANHLNFFYKHVTNVLDFRHVLSLLNVRKHGISVICVVIEVSISCQLFPDTFIQDVI